MEADIAIHRARAQSVEGVDPRSGAWLWTSFSVTVVAIIAGVVLAPTGKEVPVRSLTLLLFLGSSVHVATTGYLFTEADIRAHSAGHRIRYVWMPLLLIVSAATLASLLSVRDLAWSLLPYFAWQFFHFHKQNIGMVALAARSTTRRGLSASERWTISVASLFGIAGLLAHPGLLQLSVVTPFSRFFGFAFLGFACAAVSGIALLLVRVRREQSAGFVATYLMALFFFAPVFVFRSPYAAVGGMTIGHGFQYLVLVGLVAAGRSRGRNRAFGPVLLFNLALFGGILLSTASHLHNAPALGRAMFGAYLGVTMAHFVIDAGIWRLRDPFSRAFLASRVPFLVPAMVEQSWRDRS